MTNDRRPLIAVLGASGFIGTSVTAALAGRPVRVRAVARRPSVRPPGAKAYIEVCTADLTGRAEVARAIAGADAVIHLVAHITGAATWRVAHGDPVGERVNLGTVTTLVDVLRAGRFDGAPPVVLFAGSASQVCKGSRVRIDGTEPDEAVTVYGRQKLDAERALKAASAVGFLRAAILRLPTVFGQGAGVYAPDRGVVATMVRRALAGDPLTMWNDGTVERDLVYVDDAARAFVTALDHADALAGRHWLIGSGRRTSLATLFGSIAEMVSARTGRPPVPVVSVPAPAEATAADFRSVEVDSSAFGSVTGWAPRIALHDGLAATVDAISGEMQAAVARKT